MSDEDPTADEIARVEAWKSKRATVASRANARERDKKIAAQLEAMRQKMAGRTIVSIEGSSVDSYGDWRTLRLVFDDGGAVEVDGAWGDERGVEIDFTDPA